MHSPVDLTVHTPLVLICVQVLLFHNFIWFQVHRDAHVFISILRRSQIYILMLQHMNVAPAIDNKLLSKSLVVTRSALRMLKTPQGGYQISSHNKASDIRIVFLWWEI